MYARVSVCVCTRTSAGVHVFGLYVYVWAMDEWVRVRTFQLVLVTVQDALVPVAQLASALSSVATKFSTGRTGTCKNNDGTAVTFAISQLGKTGTISRLPITEIILQKNNEYHYSARGVF